MISTEPNKWDSDDAKILKDFLASSTGAIALQHVLYSMPAFSDASPHATLVSSCLREGYQRAVQALLDLQTIRPPQAEPEPNYPDLDRDELWKDSDEPPAEENTQQ